MEEKTLSKKKVSNALARRLPVYYRNVCAMVTEGVQNLTSAELAARIGNTSAQVRQDFYTCGGVNGYNAVVLKDWLGAKIGLENRKQMVVVGTGNLGRAIISFKGFNKLNFFIDAAFDSDLMLKGMQINGVPILNVSILEKYLLENKVDILVITTPAGAAQEIFEMAVKCGVKGVWNFAPVDLRPKEGVEVENMHLGDSLMTLSFRIREKEENQALKEKQQK